MLSKKRDAKKAAIARESRQLARGDTDSPLSGTPSSSLKRRRQEVPAVATKARKLHSETEEFDRSTTSRSGKRPSARHDSSREAIAGAMRAAASEEGGTGLRAGPQQQEGLLQEIGDHINTRLQEISAAELEELGDDVDVFDEKKRAAMEEARLQAGTRQRCVADSIQQHLRAQQQTTSDTALTTHSIRIGHNSNSITAIAMLGCAEVIVLGDKSGKVYYVRMEDTSSATATSSSSAAMPREGADTSSKQRAHSSPGQRVPVGATEGGSHDAAPVMAQRKRLLMPVMASGVMSLAISDTRDAFATSRQLFEKSTVDTSCTSYIAAGCADGSISVWETHNMRHKGLLWLHRKPVTGLFFRPFTSTLVSVSDDHTLRVWSPPQMLSIDHFFGHEGAVKSCDGLQRNACATVGADGTMRYWKLDAATQQAYTYVKPTHAEGTSSTSPSAAKPSKTTLDTVVMLNESMILAGSQDGELILYDINKRRPVFVKPDLHGSGFAGDGTGLEKICLKWLSSAPRTPRVPNPLTAVAAVPYGDVCATASYDGVVRLWEVTGMSDAFTAAGRRRFTPNSSAAPLATDLAPLAAFPVPGIVNALRFSPSGDVLVVATAKEPREGRWVVQREALNAVWVLPLTPAGQHAVSQSRGPIEHLPAQLFQLPEQKAAENDPEDDEAVEENDPEDNEAVEEDVKGDEAPEREVFPFQTRDGAVEGPAQTSSKIKANKKKNGKEGVRLQLNEDGSMRMLNSVSSSLKKKSSDEASARSPKKSQKMKLKKKQGQKSSSPTPTGHAMEKKGKTANKTALRSGGSSGTSSPPSIKIKKLKIMKAGKTG